MLFKSVIFSMEIFNGIKAGSNHHQMQSLQNGVLRYYFRTCNGSLLPLPRDIDKSTKKEDPWLGQWCVSGILRWLSYSVSPPYSMWKHREVDNKRASINNILVPYCKIVTCEDDIENPVRFEDFGFPTVLASTTAVLLHVLESLPASSCIWSNSNTETVMRILSNALRWFQKNQNLLHSDNRVL